ncbi:uncharacterized protein VICG_00821 [Vittaforma corneae ATCC 50505]|uniref:Uncharacterized protein n=1 Tax=Vittaforma corneae (strain ATCC 50505) TaxID=993615 RepID=L2GMQ8_VITCO|nr:uncharacterized protein VICG_00821 [Vittaforma corneae ATCC 50505]ELA42178.1 hypothetical protein VICG_00821 [Vittaforma corneae ATCC 50505]
MQRELVIDGTDHVVGKLAAFVAKKALGGMHYTCCLLRKHGLHGSHASSCG